jgi:hypothetical protein
VALVVLVLLCLRTFVWSVRNAGRRLQRLRDEQRGELMRAEWPRPFTTTIFAENWLRRRQMRLLDHNPLTWLQQHSWSDRLTKWGWCFGVVLVESLMLAWYGWRGNYYNFLDPQMPLLLALTSGITFTSVASFHREKENGVMELLLVSPMTAKELIRGRARGIWWQFLPATAALALFGWIGFHFQAERQILGQPVWQPWGPWASLMAVGIGAFLSLPMVGCYFSLRARSRWVAWVLTWIGGVVVPLLFGVMVTELLPWDEFIASHVYRDALYPVLRFLRSLVMASFFIGSGGLAAYLLQHCLDRRLFSFR